MHIYSVTRLGSRFSLLIFMLLFAAQILPVYAQDPAAYISIRFGNHQTSGTMTIGRSFPLYIDISTGANPVRATSLQCFQNGTSLSASSISRLPNSSIITPGQPFYSEQYYRSVSAGTTTVYCVFKGTDTVNGQPFTVTSNREGITVSGEQRLYVDAYSATRTATVGQAIFFTVIYGNRGRNTLTNVQVSCMMFAGRPIAFVSSRQTQTTLPSGQSGFAEYRFEGLARRAAGVFLCTVTTTDSVTGEIIILNTPAVPIEIV